MKKIVTAVQVFRTRGLRGVLAVVLGKLAATETSDVIDVSDEFTSWLGFVNAGMLTKGNLHCMEYAIQNVEGNEPFLEIGSFCGLSTNLITYFKKKNGVFNRLITCDKWIFEGSDKSETVGDSPIQRTDLRAYVKESYLRNIQMFSRDDLPYTIEMLSNEFFESWEKHLTVTDVLGRALTMGGDFSFCFIDGDHSYEGAKHDFEKCDKHLVQGGFILFDDSDDDSGWGVCDVVREVQEEGRYELVMKNPNYLFRKL